MLRPLPGAHNKNLGTGLATLLKDVLKMCGSMKEVKYLLNNRQIFINGRRVKEPRFSVGIFDSVSFMELKEHYRVILSDKGKFKAIKINTDEAELRPSRIINKTLVKGGKVQLNLDDGTNIIISKDEPFKVKDSVLVLHPQKKIVSHLPLSKGAYVFIIGGKHIGKHGAVEEIKEKDIILKTAKGDVKTAVRHALVIGSSVPYISLGEKTELPAEIKKRVEQAKSEVKAEAGRKKKPSKREAKEPAKTKKPNKPAIKKPQQDKGKKKPVKRNNMGEGHGTR